MADIEQLQEWANLDNLATLMSEEDLLAWGLELKKGIEEDIQSRAQWERQYTKWIELATQVTETKNKPWPNAANIKLPVLCTASLNFQARAYPALVPDDNVVKTVVVGEDTDGSKQAAAVRVSKFMSAQCKHLITNWEDDFDRGLFILPFSGVIFKKIYRDAINNKNCSDLVLPTDLIVNYYAKDLATAGRVTHRLEFTSNDIQANESANVWIEEPKLQEPEVHSKAGQSDRVQGITPPATADSATTILFYECHCWRDLDGDGYEEPYITMLEAKSGRIVRVAPRWASGDGSIVVKPGTDTFVKINPREHFVRFPFIQDPYSGVYGLGWGALVGPLNDSVNSIINMMLDSGHLYTLQAGFIGKNVKILGGASPFKPGEWKIAQYTGDDINRHLAPLPVREPSMTLLNLLQLLLGYTDKLALTMDAMVGEIPGQNTKSGVMAAAIEQGGKVYNAIYKRLYRSLYAEFKLLYELNSSYLAPEEYFTVLDSKVASQEQVFKADFNKAKVDILPAAAPDASSIQQRLMKAQALVEVAQLGPLNTKAIQLRMLEALEEPNIEELFNVPDPGPPPEVQMLQMELQTKMEMQDKELQIKMMELQMKGLEIQATAFANQAKGIKDLATAENLQQEPDMKRAQMLMDHVATLNEQIQKRMELDHQKKVDNRPKPNASA